MRARNIKPGFFTNEELVELPALTRILFQGLWCIADREGRLEDRPRKIKMEVLPADDIDMNASLQSLHDCGLIIRYEVDGKNYICIPNFTKHQTPHPRETQSIIPVPSPVQAQIKDMPRKCQGHTLNGARQCQDHRNPDILNPESPSRNPDVLNLESACGGGNAAARDDPSGVDHPPIADYCAQNLMSMSSGNYTDLREFMADGLTDELVIYAVDEASAQGKRSWAYVRSMLNRWLTSGIRTVGEAKADSERYRAKTGASAPPGRASPPGIDPRIQALQRYIDDDKPPDGGDNP